MPLINIALVLLLVAATLAQKCPTCVDEACNNDVPLRQCSGANRFLDPRTTREDQSDFACLDLEYTEGDGVKILKQCVSMEEGERVCAILRSKASDSNGVIQKCEVKSVQDMELQDEPLPNNTTLIPSTETAASSNVTEASNSTSPVTSKTSSQSSSVSTTSMSTPSSAPTSSKPSTKKPAKGGSVIPQVSISVILIVTTFACLI